MTRTNTTSTTRSVPTRLVLGSGALLAFTAVLMIPSLALAAEGGSGAWYEAWYFLVAGGAVNLGIYIWILVKFGGPKINSYLKNRKETIEEDMTEAARLREEAESRLDEVQAKIDKFDKERETILAEYRRIGESEKERIIAEAEAQATRIRKEAKLSAETEMVRAQQQIEQQVLEKALELAEKALEERVKPANHNALVDDTVKSLSAL